jgi:hypothetical protein
LNSEVIFPIGFVTGMDVFVLNINITYCSIIFAIHNEGKKFMKVFCKIY